MGREETGGRGAALVTGAAKGIGLATARALARAGYRIAALDNDAAALAAADLPGNTIRVHHDVGDTSVDVMSLLGEAGPVSVLVNNVGVMDGRSFLEMPAADAARTLLTNVVGTWAVSRAVAGQMIAGGVGGCVVFNLSLHSSRVRMCPDYSVSKAALLMLMQEMAVELGPHGIRVNAVSPGAVDTGYGGVGDGDGHRARSASLVPLRRVGEPDDVARVIAWLCSEDAGYVTGADIRVDGGLYHYNWLHHLYGDAAGERGITRPTATGRSD